MLLRLDGVGRSLGARMLFRDAELTVYAGDRIGIVGPNGAGKTTLLRIAAGEEPPDAGRVARVRDVRVGMLRQEIDPRLARSVREEVSSVLGHLDDARARDAQRSRPRWRAAGARARRCPRSSRTATTARARDSSSAAASRARRASSACWTAWASPSPPAPGPCRASAAAG